MHELAITKQLVEDLLKLVKDMDLPKVKKVVVDIGDKTSYKAEPMNYYFDELKTHYEAIKETIFQGQEIIGKNVMLKEIETLKNISLFYETRSQNSVPRPILVNGFLGFWNRVCRA